MSTCRGAAPPHKDCPHGDRCDWDGVRSIKGLHSVTPAPPQPGMNRAERRAMARRKK